MSRKKDNSGNLLKNSYFDGKASLPWHISQSDEKNAYTRVENGEYIIHIENGGVNRWDVQVRHREFTIEKGHTYRVSFKARATKDCQIYAKIGMQGPPYTEYWNNGWQPYTLPANKTVKVDTTFTMTSPTDSVVELAFFFGGNLVGKVPYEVALDDIVLWDDQYKAPPPEKTVEQPKIRVNQVGYLPDAAKRAVLVSKSTSPVKWKLKDAAGKEATNGVTQVYGLDSASNDFVHIIDFSSFKTPGKDYRLFAGNLFTGSASSYPFDISPDIYGKMKYDALAYFYYNRSGIEIKMPYAGYPQLCRPAGHLPDQALSADRSEDFIIDATGGWYDAGDYGKYVVNGGISVWTMMNQFERTQYIKGASSSPFEDGKMNIPENSNGYPDILDEARWEMEMLLKMQIPQGNPKAGMAVHKLHDVGWTALAIKPDDDIQMRVFYPPSTAATLNLAATAAQSARIWQKYDRAFSDKCLKAAETAWKAALQYPDEYAPATNNKGGGPYDDSYCEDEFYWAAAELYITTGNDRYLDYLKGSRFFLQMPSRLTEGGDKGLTGAFTWQNVSGLGTLSLALVPNKLTEQEVETARQNIAKASDAWIEIQNKQGYLVPITKYPWGSNSFILNEMIVMAYAYDFTKDTKYFNAVTESMDYILGRNAMCQSYVTGYGENPVKNPHHRFWAYQANREFPKAPPGAIAGGANSGCEDPWMQGAGLKGSPPQKCYVDNIEAYACNEITINWNAPFAWVTAFIDEKANPGR
ncbi:MAG: glycoside hydrolase family 9 protein [Peptococcaceae bacterium]|nr:glycoside hydrolase family 9 protein [Peptococcaceae bacterium]